MAGEKCFICGEAISGESRRDPYGRFWCASHSVRRCPFCRAAFAGPGNKIEGFSGRYCDNCARPKSYGQAMAIWKYVAGYLTERGLFIPRHSMSLLSGAQMRDKYLKTFGSTPRGVTNKSGDVYHIDILSQQPSASMAAVMAHESMHAAQWARGIDAPDGLDEGFCNLVAYEITASIRDPHAAVHLSMMMENPDPAYGTAFRQLKVLYDSRGWEAVLKLMQSFRKPK